MTRRANQPHRKNRRRLAALKRLEDHAKAVYGKRTYPKIIKEELDRLTVLVGKRAPK